MEIKNEVENLLLENEILERNTETLQTRMGLINASINELYMANETLEGLKKEDKGSIILVPIGGGSYLKAIIEDVKNILVGIGSDVATEKTIKEAQDNLGTNILELEKARERINKQLEQNISRLNTVRRKIQEIQNEAKRT